MSNKKNANANKIYIMITRKQKYPIPTDSPFLLDINPTITNKLLMSHKYAIHCNASWEVLQSFLDYGINRILPNINNQNFIEYEKLSEEFDFMKDLVQLYKKFFPTFEEKRIKNMHKEVLSFKLQQLLEDYQRNIHMILKYGYYDSNYTYLNLKENYYYEYSMNEIALNVMKKIKYGDGEYAIDEYSKTAGVVGFNSEKSYFYVPNEIEYNSEKVQVTSFLRCNCHHNVYIEFQPNSPLKLIARRSLDNSNIIRLTIPASVERIEEGYITMKSDIQFRILRSQNKKENNILNAAYSYAIKSAPPLDYYDILFAPEGKTNAQEISCFIKRIASYAFIGHCLISGVHFSQNSILESIGSFAFYGSQLRSIRFPASLTVIENEAFRCCVLFQVEFPRDSKLKEIGDFAFCNNKITSLSLPSSLVKLGYGSFSFNNINSVCFDNDSLLEEIGGDSFGSNCLNSFKIPPKVKKLGEKVLDGNEQLTCIELTSKFLPEIDRYLYFNNIQTFVIPSHLIFDINNEKWKEFIFKSSKIQIKNNDEVNIKYIEHDHFIIGRSTDSETFSVLYYSFKNIKKVTISSYIETISSYSFYNCKHLKSVNFEDNSKLKVIENSVFLNTPIEELSIPSSVCVFKQECFKGTNNLINIKIIPNKIQNVIFFNNSMLIGKREYNNDDAKYDIIHFVSRNLTEIKIPSFIKEISSSSFDSCKKINKIEFEKNSNLEVINDSQFKNLNITHIEIPNKVTSFGEYSFNNCKYLKFINLKDDSKLSSIGSFAFTKASIKSLFIPSSVSKIYRYAFYGLHDFQILEIGKDSNLKTINYSDFCIKNAILMIPAELSCKVDTK